MIMIVIMMMIQVMDSRKHLYNGTWLCDQARLEMTSVCLNKKPAHCNYLSGQQRFLMSFNTMTTCKYASILPQVYWSCSETRLGPHSLYPPG